MITRMYGVKILVKHISCDCKSKLIVHYAIQIKDGIMINVNVSVKSIIRAKKIIAGILACVFVRMVGI